MRTSFLNAERRLAAVSMAALGMLTAAVSVVKPGHSWLLPPCPLHAVTGFLCPGCGSTRALYLLVHGNLIAALHENALSVALLPFVLYELGAIFTRRYPALSTRLRPWMLWSFLALVIAFAVLRNVPYPPFLALAPHELP